MSTLLALDTATARPSLAIGSPGEWREELVIPHRHQLSLQIERAARDLLQPRGIAAGDLSGVVVADGPGSFTGLRIGIAFAKGVCRALGVPLFTTPSMLGAARAVARDGEVVVVEYDALRGEVYRAAWRFLPGRVQTVMAPVTVPAGSPLGGSPGPEPRRAGEANAGAVQLIELSGVHGGAAVVADPGGWEPLYGRRAEAEERRLARERHR